MSIHGEIAVGRIVIQGDRVILEAGVNLVDAKLGVVGSRLLQPSDPAVEAQVRAFIQASLPALSAFAGYEITLPEAQTPPTPVSTPPTIVTSPVTR
jgi:glycine cleavage system regulatory protein